MIAVAVAVTRSSGANPEFSERVAVITIEEGKRPGEGTHN